MQIIELTDAATSSTARIAAHLGFNCFEFKARLNEATVLDVIASAEGFADGDKPPSHSGVPLLFPFPNRVRDAKFSWEGQDYELPESLVGHEGQGNAIHGFCLDRPWRVTEQSASSVTGVFRTSQDAPERLPLWPADAEIEVTYTLHDNCLRADVTVRNPSDVPLPFGFGTHAYFRLPHSEATTPDQCTVFAPVSAKWELESCLPTGKVIPAPADARLATSPRFSGLKLDDVYTEVQSEEGIVSCRITDEGTGTQVEQRCDDSFREIVAFTPPWTSAVCLEPYTCTTDAINLQQQGISAGLRVLKPGEEFSCWIEIIASHRG